MKVIQLRKEKQAREVEVLRDKPMLSPGTRAIAWNLKLKDTYARQDAFIWKKQMGLDWERRMIEQEENSGFTGKPEINWKSQSITRSINDLYAWEAGWKQRIEHHRAELEDEEMAEVWATQED